MLIDTARHAELAAEVLPRAQLLIGGSWSDGGGGTYAHVNPATGREQAPVGLASAADVDAAVAAARSALPVWRGMRPDERRNALQRLAGLIRSQAERIGRILTLEC